MSCESCKCWYLKCWLHDGLQHLSWPHHRHLVISFGVFFLSKRNQGFTSKRMNSRVWNNQIWNKTFSSKTWITPDIIHVHTNASGPVYKIVPHFKASNTELLLGPGSDSVSVSGAVVQNLASYPTNGLPLYSVDDWVEQTENVYTYGRGTSLNSSPKNHEIRPLHFDRIVYLHFMIHYF